MTTSSVRNTSASYFQFQQSLNQYVFFSPLTLGGASGRAVKIHKDLFLPFFCVVDPNTHDGQSIIRQIENLRATCTIARAETGSNYASNPRESVRHKTQLGKVNSAFHQVLIIKNLHVHYRVSQEEGDKAPSIYVTSIRFVGGGTSSPPGLYEAKLSFGSDEARAEKFKNHIVDGKKIYINGSAQSVGEAMGSAYSATKDNNALLFYCPASVAGDMGIMGSPAKSHVTKETLQELVSILKKNQRPSKNISWYAEAEGVNLLAEALKQIPGELTKHEFRLINPIANTSRLLKSLTEKKAVIEGEFFQHSQNKTALISLGVQKDQLLEARRKKLRHNYTSTHC